MLAVLAQWYPSGRTEAQVREDLMGGFSLSLANLYNITGEPPAVLEQPAEEMPMSTEDVMEELFGEDF